MSGTNSHLDLVIRTYPVKKERQKYEIAKQYCAYTYTRVRMYDIICNILIILRKLLCNWYITAME